MPAVFNKSVVKIPPPLKSPDSKPISATKDYVLASELMGLYPLAVTSVLPIAMQGCSRSYAPFPSGFLYTNVHGLMDFKQRLSFRTTTPQIISAPAGAIHSESLTDKGSEPQQLSKMLAVFSQSVAKKISPSIKNPGSNPISNGFLDRKLLEEYYPHATTLGFRNRGHLAIDDRAGSWELGA